MVNESASTDEQELEAPAPCDLPEGEDRTPAPLPYPAPVSSPGILPEDSLAEAGRKIMRALFAELLQHEEGARQGQDIEEIHDMRVATRRLRAAFDVFGPALKSKVVRRHLKGLRNLGRILGRVRDLDVLLEKAHAYLELLPDDHQSDLAALTHAWENQRLAAWIDLLVYLDSDPYNRFKQRFNRFVQTPGSGVNRKAATASTQGRVNEIVPVLIYQKLAEVRAFTPVFFDEITYANTSVERLHALRIAFKKLRYSVEYFREILRAECNPVINDLKRMQDHLGDLHDGVVSTGLLDEFIGQFPPAGQSHLHGVVAYRVYRRLEFDYLRETLPAAWQYFNRPEFKSNLSLAISIL